MKFLKEYYLSMIIFCCSVCLFLILFCDEDTTDVVSTISYEYDEQDKNIKKIVKKKVSKVVGDYAFTRKKVCEKYSREEVYQYFNSIRKIAGMLELDRVDWLEETAQNHSEYLYMNRLAGHKQNKNKSYFTGVNPSDRALYTGSDNKYILEGISTHGIGQTPIVYIDRLMAAIYHRFTILDFNTDILGIGVTEIKNNCMYNLVHNQSNSYLNSFCQEDTSYSILHHSKSYCKARYIPYNNISFAFNNIRNTNPQYVQWPAENQVNVQTMFVNNERPNPMPKHKITGYPISIQFNKFNYRTINFVDFKLYDSDYNEITNKKVLRKETDQNKVFSNLEFALFPIEVLEKDSLYYVSFVHEIDGAEENIFWSFMTGKY